MNKTIETMLNHKSIRKFKDQEIDPEIISTLVDVARHTSTSNFMQSYSIISVSDQEKKEAIAKVGNQPYIAESAHLFIMVIDQNRNMHIAKEKGQDTEVLHSFDRFLIAACDALLASQNILTAAESLGLGGVVLGSILNQADQTAEILGCPEFVFPILGIALGYPDQTPQLKPRLPQELMHFENEYPQHENLHQKLQDYDKTVHEYYDLRDANRRVDQFTKQITEGMNRKHPGRMKLLEFLQEKGFAKY
ncbi:oxygen-insensitive NADPH nitroreductase [Erysipelothrix urinaevulpis]|uniref:oxygen-insensitive NADPH nitroreductase n=1 Tax=Erysipelothrix urinaevulpis TaxID=2683717 RepID=UPI0013582540|nr:oxygen-insensitive NADPH nitroreductase [Erysipelothrix urinaevulpis]